MSTFIALHFIHLMWIECECTVPKASPANMHAVLFVDSQKAQKLLAYAITIAAFEVEQTIFDHLRKVFAFAFAWWGYASHKNLPTKFGPIVIENRIMF